MSPDAANPALTRAVSEPDAFRDLIGYHYVSTADGRVEVCLTIDARHRNRAGYLHGGIPPLLLTAAGALAVYAADPAVSFAVNASMAISYMRGARDGSLIARATVERLGTALAHVRMELVASAAADVALATAQGVYHLRR